MAEVGEVYLVFGKVRLGDVMYLANEPQNRKYHNNQIHCKHFDYLICDREAQRPMLAIELDDGTHIRFRARASDAFKDRVCTQIGLPLLRLSATNYPSGELARQVNSKLNEHAAD